MSMTLVILAAGMGSRYGGLKQLEGFGPQGETLMDYSVMDATEAGFERVIFVIRKDFEAAFEAQVLSKFRGKMRVDVAYQDLNDLPAGRRPPEGRVKPWGTAHAVLAARHLIDGPFVMVNADDYYGPEAFALMKRFFESRKRKNDCAMAGYRLADTLSAHGGVTRALCHVDSAGYLTNMQELKGLRREADGKVHGEGVVLTGEEPVSMNCFGFQGDFIGLLRSKFEAFLSRRGAELDSECLIPEVVGELCLEGRLRLKVAEGSGVWFGVTYPQDKAFVQTALAKLRRSEAVQA